MAAQMRRCWMPGSSPLLLKPHLQQCLLCCLMLLPPLPLSLHDECYQERQQA